MKSNGDPMAPILKVGHLIQYLWLPVSLLLGIHLWLLHNDTKGQIADAMKETVRESRMELQRQVTRLEDHDREMIQKMVSVEAEQRDLLSRIEAVELRQKEVRRKLKLDSPE